MGSFKDSYAGIPLSDTDLVDPHHREKLEALSITTVEELLSSMRAAPAAMAQFMEGTNLPQLAADAGMKAGPSLLTVTAAEQAFEGMRFELGAVPPVGVVVEEVAQESTFREMFDAIATKGAPEGPTADLRACFGPIRNQGDRGTCVGHAGAAVVECLHHSQTGNIISFSPQFLFHNSKKRDGSESQDGTWSRIALATLLDQGICKENMWPYEPDVIPGDVHHGPPPAAAVADALNHVARDVIELPNRDSARIREFIDDGKPVTISVPVYQNWWGPITKATGKIPMPLPLSQLDGGHAMCVVGYDFDDDFTGGGYFIVRNSWGEMWAKDSPIGPGYGAIPFEYIDRYGWEAYTIDLEAPTVES